MAKPFEARGGDPTHPGPLWQITPEFGERWYELKPLSPIEGVAVNDLRLLFFPLETELEKAGFFRHPEEADEMVGETYLFQGNSDFGFGEYPYNVTMFSTGPRWQVEHRSGDGIPASQEECLEAIRQNHMLAQSLPDNFNDMNARHSRSWLTEALQSATMENRYIHPYAQQITQKGDTIQKRIGGYKLDSEQPTFVMQLLDFVYMKYTGEIFAWSIPAFQKFSGDNKAGSYRFIKNSIQQSAAEGYFQLNGDIFIPTPKFCDRFWYREKSQ